VFNAGGTPSAQANCDASSRQDVTVVKTKDLVLIHLNPIMRMANDDVLVIIKIVTLKSQHEPRAEHYWGFRKILLWTIICTLI
jgi:hypothetical protein